MAKKILIVGGVAGGATAAARLRRLDEHAQIIMFEREEQISIANCGLPYYIGGTIPLRQQLLVQTPEAMMQRFRIDIRTKSEVIAVHPERKTVTVKDAAKGTYEENYDVLLLSPGAKPILPSMPGIEDERIFTLRNIPDTDRIMDYIEKHQVKRAAVIGGGFIGIETAENLIQRGIDTTVVEAAPQILAPFDADMVTYAQKELTDHGVRLILNDRVQAFRSQPNSLIVELASGDRLDADLVLMAIGVQPDTAFLRDSGIELGPRGHIIVNAHMQTNIPEIYAVGDAVMVSHLVHGEMTAIPLAGPANKQARIAADHICGLDSAYRGSQGTSIIKIFGLTGAATGLNERSLRQAGIDYQTVHLHPASHATYYPGAEPIALKLLFDGSGRVLGAQAFGREGVDKRIDVIAAMIRMNGTVDDLAELELAYAPPYSSAKDPVNMAGFIAQNVLSGRTQMITADELDRKDPDAITLIDVSSEAEFLFGHIEGAVNIPVDELRDRLHEIDTSKEVIVYCQVGQRGYTAARILAQRGILARNLSGGYRSYIMAKYA